MANFFRFLAVSGLVLVVWWSRFWNSKHGKRRTIMMLPLLFVALPAVSGHGALRLQYMLPFAMIIL